MSEWHVWTVSANKHNKINTFLSELPNIDSFIYPMSKKEYSTKKGKRFKDIPIYSNYIFIKYAHSVEMEIAIKNCAWINDYIGKCSANDIEHVKQQTGLKYDDLVAGTPIQRGDNVKLVRTPFSGWEAVVVNVMDNKLDVNLCILGTDRIIKCNKDDVELISR